MLYPLFLDNFDHPLEMNSEILFVFALVFFGIFRLKIFFQAELRLQCVRERNGCRYKQFQISPETIEFENSDRQM